MEHIMPYIAVSLSGIAIILSIIALIISIGGLLDVIEWLEERENKNVI